MPKSSPQPRVLRSCGYNQSLRDHPIAPTEFPKRWSTIQLIQRLSAITEYNMHLSGGGYLPPVTPLRTATGLGLPPSVLRIMIAISQQSTDSDSACQAQS